jgi:hypothetical protein
MEIIYNVWIYFTESWEGNIVPVQGSRKGVDREAYW